jgi:Carboxypeptidase activation peptide
MQSIEEDFDRVKYWILPMERNQTVDFIVPPDMVGVMKDFLRERQINFEVVSKDLQVSPRSRLIKSAEQNENFCNCHAA